MKKVIVCLTLMMAVMGVSADAMVMNKLSLNGWGGTPTIATIADPNGDAVVGEGAIVAEGLVDPRICIAQTFKVGENQTALKLDKIAIWEDGSEPLRNPYTLRLVDLGTVDPSYQGGGSQTYASGTDLWGGNMTAEYHGSSVKSALEFDFENEEELTLLAGHYYAFEITATSPVGGLWWYRATAAGSNYADGTMFSDTLNTTPGIRDQLYKGSDGRDLAMAIYFVPEPTTIAILTIGGLGLLLKRREIVTNKRKGENVMKKLSLSIIIIIALSFSAFGSVTPYTGPLTDAFLSVDLNGGKSVDLKPTQGSINGTDSYGVVWTAWGGDDGGQLPQSQEGLLPNTKSITKQFGSLANVTISAGGTPYNYHSTYQLDSRDRGEDTSDKYLFRDFVFGRKSGSNVQGTNYLQVDFGGLIAGEAYEIAMYSYDSCFETSTNWTATAPTLQGSWMGWWSDKCSDEGYCNIFEAPEDQQTVAWGATGIAPAPAIFNLVADSTGKITLYGFGGSGVDADQNAQNSYFNGFQIAFSQAVPEPTTIALLGLGLILFRKRGN